MLTTPIYKFRKPELNDSPPDITVTNWNWDEVEKQIKVLSETSILNKGHITSMSQVTTHGEYRVQNGDRTFPYPYGNLLVTQGAGELHATFSATGDRLKSYEAFNVGAGWGQFKALATTDKIDISSLCVNGWKLSEYRHGIVSKVGGCVIANLSVSGGGKNYGTVIFQLPQGYRPSTTIDIQAHCYEKSTGGWQYAVLHVDINGNVCVSNVSINDSVVFTLSFPVA